MSCMAVVVLKYDHRPSHPYKRRDGGSGFGGDNTGKDGDSRNHPIRMEVVEIRSGAIKTTSSVRNSLRAALPLIIREYCWQSRYVRSTIE